jgi:hypothetical protein
MHTTSEKSLVCKTCKYVVAITECSPNGRINLLGKRVLAKRAGINAAIFIGVK